MSRSKPPLWLRLGFSAFAAIAMAGVAELTLQILDLPKGGFSPWVRDEVTAYRYASDLDTRLSRAPEYDVSFQTNAEGLRDDPTEVPEGQRVLLLGDSFTSGYGAERGEVFADLLEQELAVDVINAGVGGWELIHQAHYAEQAMDRYDPDLVVYVLYLGNDLALNGEWAAESGSLRSLTKEFPLRPPLDIKLASLVRGARYGLRARQAREAGEWLPFPEYLALSKVSLDADGRERWDLAAKWLSELVRRVKAAGRDLFIVTFPYRTVVEPTARRRFEDTADAETAAIDLDLTAKRAHAMLVEAGVDFASLEPALAEAAAKNEPLYFPIDGHWTPAGHRVVAKALTPLLRARLRVVASD